MIKKPLVFLILGCIEVLSGFILTFFFGIVIYYFYASGASILFLCQSSFLMLFCLSLFFSGIILIKKMKISLLAHLTSLIFYFASLFFIYLWANEWKTSIFADLHKFFWQFWWMVFPVFILIIRIIGVRRR